MGKFGIPPVLDTGDRKFESCLADFTDVTIIGVDMEWETIKFWLHVVNAEVIHTGTYSECIEWREKGNSGGGWTWGDDRLIIMSRRYLRGQTAYGVRVKRDSKPVTNFGFIS